jgi:hypothetical protein
MKTSRRGTATAPGKFVRIGLACIVTTSSILSAQVKPALPKQRSVAATTACAPLTWSSPRSITMAGGEPIYVETPVPIRMRDDIVMLGNPSIIWRSATVFADTSRTMQAQPSIDALAGASLRIGEFARPILRPLTAKRFLSPRAVLHGVSLDVVWGESADTTAHSDLYVPELWHATFDGAHWSSPELVLRAHNIWWNNSSAAPALIDGELQLAVPADNMERTAEHAGVAYLRRLPEGWRTTWISTLGPMPSSVGLASTAANVVVAFVGGVIRRKGPSDMNDVFVARSVDGGATWSDIAVVNKLASLRAAGLQLVPAAATLHLIWVTEGDAGGHVAHEHSDDSGVTWNQDPGIDLTEPLEALTAANHSAGIFAIGRGERTGTLFSLRWPTASTAPVVSRLPFETAASVPEVAAIGSDTLMLVWGVQRSHAYPLFPTLPAPADLMSYLVARCD